MRTILFTAALLALVTLPSQAAEHVVSQKAKNFSIKRLSVQQGDSVRFVNLARVGQGRALLDLGRYAEAAAAVASVPDDYRYDELFEPGTLRPWSGGPANTR